MTKGGKAWLAGGAGILLVGATICGVNFLTRHGKRRGDGHASDDEVAAASGGRWRGFAAGTPGIAEPGAAGGAAAAPAGGADGMSPTEVAARVKAVMDAWRNAVVVKDADTVLSLDALFTATPARYADALAKSAASDDNERVRAFCTRVLGKFKDARQAELYARLLEDRSPYVRQNAAWALGELGGEPEGREAAQRATTALQRLEQHDAAADVRVAANSALKRLQ